MNRLVTQSILVLALVLSPQLSTAQDPPPPQATLAVFPNSGQAAAMCTADVPGRWAVWSSSLGEPLMEGITILQLKNDNTLCVFTADAGKYVFQFVPNDYTVPFAYAKVVLGGEIKPGPGPGPGPGPTPPPTPGPRTVVVISEEDSTTAYREVAIQTLRTFVVGDSKHSWDLSDPDDLEGATGQQAEDLKAYLGAMKEDSIPEPAILVIAKEGGKEFITVIPFPDPGNSVDSGRAAGEAAIKIVKELGG